MEAQESKDILEKVKEVGEVKTTDFIELVKRLGYKVNLSYKNVNHKKTKLLIYTENERHPSAWVLYMNSILLEV